MGRPFSRGTLTRGSWTKRIRLRRCPCSCRSLPIEAGRARFDLRDRAMDHRLPDGGGEAVSQSLRAWRGGEPPASRIVHRDHGCGRHLHDAVLFVGDGDCEAAVGVWNVADDAFEYVGAYLRISDEECADDTPQGCGTDESALRGSSPGTLPAAL